MKKSVELSGWLEKALREVEEYNARKSKLPETPDPPEGNPLGKISSAATTRAAKKIASGAVITGGTFAGTSTISSLPHTTSPAWTSVYPTPLRVQAEYDIETDSLRVRTEEGAFNISRARLLDLLHGHALIRDKNEIVDKRASTALEKEEAAAAKIASQAASLSVLWEFIEERGLMAEAVAWCDERSASVST